MQMEERLRNFISNNESFLGAVGGGNSTVEQLAPDSVAIGRYKKAVVAGPIFSKLSCVTKLSQLVTLFLPSCHV